MKNLKYFFAAGGTGGHIFPALAIARAMEEHLPAVDIHFVGTRRGLEKKIIPPKGYPLHLLTVGQLNRNVSLLTRLTTVCLLPFAFLQALIILLYHRPRAVIGVGGYASGPLLLVASLLRIPTMIWEPNAFPGMANRSLASLVDFGFVMFEETLKHFSLKNHLIVGYPLREQIETAVATNSLKKGDPEELINSAANAKLALDTKNEPNLGPQVNNRASGGLELKVFVFGGSQGSRAINNSFMAFLRKHGKNLKSMKFVHQVGATDFEKVKKEYENLPERVQSIVEYFEFIEKMDHYYSWADIALCRSGMGTLAELAAMSLASILVPLPSAADNHQEKNALELIKINAAILLRQDEMHADSLNDLFLKLQGDPKGIDLMAQNVHKLYKPKAAAEIGHNILHETICEEE